MDLGFSFPNLYMASPVLYVLQMVILSWLTFKLFFKSFSRNKLNSHSYRDAFLFFFVSLSSLGVISVLKIEGLYQESFNPYKMDFMTSGFFIVFEVLIWISSFIGLIFSVMYFKKANSCRLMRKKERSQLKRISSSTFIGDSVNREGYVAIYGIGGRIEISKADLNIIQEFNNTVPLQETCVDENEIINVN